MIVWTQRIVIVVFIAAAVVGGLYAKRMLDFPQPLFAGDPVRHLPAAPTIGQVKMLASLVTLDVPITDMHVSQLEGLTGSVKLAMAVAGDVQIATNLEAAEFVDVDREAMTAVLRLPRPEPERPRVDHEKTRILQMTRSGLWSWLPGDAGEKTLVDRAMRQAQRRLLIAASKHNLVEKACAQTETVIGNFFGALGWTVQVQWDDTVAAAE